MIVLVTTEPIAGTPAVTDDGAAHGGRTALV